MKETTPLPVFVVGAQRSGTTMLRLMLNSHSRFAVPFETDFLAPMFSGTVPSIFSGPDDARRSLDLLADEKFSRKGCLVADKQVILSRPLRGYSDLLEAVFLEYAHRKSKPRWAIKTPGYVTQIDEINKLFPDARLIHIVRDGRGVALSNRRISWGSSHTPTVAREWRWQVMIGRKTGRMLGDRYYEVRYEDLVLDTESTLRRLCAFLNEPYDAGMLDYHEAAATEMPADSLKWHEASISAPNASKADEWRSALPAADQILFDELAGDALDAFGYPRSTARAPVRTAMTRVYYALIRRW